MEPYDPRKKVMLVMLVAFSMFYMLMATEHLAGSIKW